MIYLDKRAGSIDLFSYLRARKLPVEVTTMSYGDISFLGNGPDGPVGVGIEVKTLGDIMKCVTDGRFAGHQLPGLVQAYDSVWLLVIGEWWANSDGILCTRRKKGRQTFIHSVTVGTRQFMYRDLDHFLMTMQMKGGIHIRTVKDHGEAALWVHDLYSWWTAKEWNEHRSHLAFNNSRDTALLRRPTLVRAMAKELPLVGWEKSNRVDQKFSSVVEMVNAPVSEWEKITGIGKKMAGDIWQAMRQKKLT